MTPSNSDFKDKYKFHPVRVHAVEEFKNNSNFSISKDVRRYMYQFMATLGMELENHFQGIVDFGNNNFKLFGREKSEKSVDTKRLRNIEEYDKIFEDIYRSGNLDHLPVTVRPIYDFYAFKLVCPEITENQKVIRKVVLDILDDIQNKHPEYKEEIEHLKQASGVSYFGALDFISKSFSEDYPDLKSKVLSINEEAKVVANIQEYLSSLNKDVSTMTYSDYCSKIIELYQLLINLSYEESVEEYVRIAQLAIDARDELTTRIENGSNDDVINENDIESFNNQLQELIEHISRKKTNKLDLALGDLMIFDVLHTSPKIKELGIKVSNDPTRTKKRRNSNGYVANFYSLDMLNGLTSEIQLQSVYRYLYGENGPAAHNKMENGIKKRTLYPMPKEKKEYKNWAKMQFKALPKYFRYIGHGFVQVYSTLQNFRRYYDTEKPEEVQAYVSYILEHDVDQLDPDILHFSLDSEPVLKSLEDESR